MIRPITRINLATQVYGVLPPENGGSNGGGSSFPSPTGHTGEFLMTDGVSYFWQMITFTGDLDGGIFDPGGTYGSFVNFDGGNY